MSAVQKQPDEAISVVLADNSRTFCELITAYLGRQPDLRLVGVARDGLGALELLEARCPDVMLLDLVMPQLDGLGVLERIRGRGPRPEPGIIVTTGLSEAGLLQLLKRLGVDGCLLKPFPLQALAGQIRRVASRRRVRQAGPGAEPFAHTGPREGLGPGDAPRLGPGPHTDPRRGPGPDTKRRPGRDPHAERLLAGGLGGAPGSASGPPTT